MSISTHSTKPIERYRTERAAAPVAAGLLLGVQLLLAAFLPASGELWAAEDSVQNDIMAEANRLEELDRMLRADNKYVRRSALEKAFESDSSVVWEMAFHAALASGDEALQARALREWLERHTIINASLELPNKASDAQKEFYRDRTPTWWGVRVQENGQLCAEFRDKRPHCKSTGSFVPGGFILNSKRYRLELRVVDETTLRGYLQNTDAVSLPVKVEIQ